MASPSRELLRHEAEHAPHLQRQIRPRAPVVGLTAGGNWDICDLTESPRKSGGNSGTGAVQMSSSTVPIGREQQARI